jgi:hypothetical protein
MSVLLQVPSNIANVLPVTELDDFQSNSTLKLAPRLTDSIGLLSPGHLEKKKVSHALHIFNNHVSAGIRFIVEKHVRLMNYSTTARFIEVMSKWFL